MSRKGVFFDLYGTLLIYGDMNASWSDWLSAFYESVKPHGLKMTIEEFAVACDGFFSHDPSDDNVHDLTIFERKILGLMQRLGVEIPTDGIKAAAVAAIEAWHTYVTLDENACDVLKKLHSSMKLALVSNFDHPPYVRNLLDQTGMGQYFDAILISGELGVSKPDPVIFQRALTQTSLGADDVVHVGDSEDDIIGAQNAGIEPIYIFRPSTGDRLDYRSASENEPETQEKPNGVRTIESLTELISIVS